jgi:GDP-4-dehydro-6-deoxy-D-mannose reductase
LIERGSPGEVYNVCSGRDVAMSEVAMELLALAGADLTLETDPALVRPVDVPVLRGDAGRLLAATGWQPTIPLATTLADVLASWEAD